MKKGEEKMSIEQATQFGKMALSIGLGAGATTVFIAMAELVIEKLDCLWLDDVVDFGFKLSVIIATFFLSLAIACLTYAKIMKAIV